MRLRNLTQALTGAALAAVLAGAAFAQAPASPLLADLARDVSAVMDAETGSPRLLLLEESQGVTNARTLAVGEEYRDGWKVSAITPTSATLEKGDQRMTTAILGREGQAAPAEATVQMAAGGLSNACTTSADRKLIEDMMKSTSALTGGMDLTALMPPQVMAQMEAEVAAMSPQERELATRMSQRMASGEFSPAVMMRASMANLPSDEEMATQARAAGVEPPPREIMAMMRSMGSSMPPMSPQDQAAFDELSSLQRQMNEARAARMSRPAAATARVASCSPPSNGSR